MDFLPGTNKYIKPALLLLILGGGFVFYFLFNPADHSFFLPCPFKLITGYDCPGCGSQRAIHQLLHGNIVAAFHLNPLLILSLPLIFYGLGIHLWNYFSERKLTAWLFYSNLFIYIYFGLVVIFWILRNLSFYPW
ncbi:DUF2752 domain-containing protein [Constantimarinum furrinae]|uniref:DUF2752 domain-containing protein n=1 Tax=Constantimarinum furrinae TaxID=2562285 RepID=UPI00164BB4CF|nr:DUF2752 domain-containing protein [Constantimarinum furrinae]